MHESKNRHNSSIWELGLCDQVTFRHAEMGHAVECQTTDESLRGLRFQRTSRKLVSKDGFQSEHNGFC